MPELPEVETIMRGISPFLEGATIKKVKLNRADLRWPFPENFASRLKEAKVLNLKRRSKYILVDLSTDLSYKQFLYFKLNSIFR